MGRKTIKNKKESLNIATPRSVIIELDEALQGKPRSPFVVGLILDFLKSTKKRE